MSAATLDTPTAESPVPAESPPAAPAPPAAESPAAADSPTALGAFEHLRPDVQVTARLNQVALLAIRRIEERLAADELSSREALDLTRALGELRGHHGAAARDFVTVHTSLVRADAIRRAADLREKVALHRLRAPAARRRGGPAGAGGLSIDALGADETAPPDGVSDGAPRPMFNREHLRAAVREIYGLDLEEGFAPPANAGGDGETNAAPEEDGVDGDTRAMAHDSDGAPATNEPTAPHALPADTVARPDPAAPETAPVIDDAAHEHIICSIVSPVRHVASSVRPRRIAAAMGHSRMAVAIAAACQRSESADTHCRNHACTICQNAQRRVPVWDTG